MAGNITTSVSHDKHVASTQTLFVQWISGPEKNAALTQDICTLLDRGATENYTMPFRTRSSYFLVQKMDCSFHPIIDLKGLCPFFILKMSDMINVM